LTDCTFEKKLIIFFVASIIVLSKTSSITEVSQQEKAQLTQKRETAFSHGIWMILLR